MTKQPAFSSDTGWQDYAVVPAKHLTKMPDVEPMTHLLSVYGIAGLTAYFGLLHVGKPKEGETVVVSAAGNELVVQGVVKSVDAETGRVTVDVTTTCEGEKVLGRCIAVVRLD